MPIPSNTQPMTSMKARVPQWFPVPSPPEQHLKWYHSLLGGVFAAKVERLITSSRKGSERTWLCHQSKRMEKAQLDTIGKTQPRHTLHWTNKKSASNRPQNMNCKWQQHFPAPSSKIIQNLSGRIAVHVSYFENSSSNSTSRVTWHNLQMSNL